MCIGFEKRTIEHETIVLMCFVCDYFLGRGLKENGNDSFLVFTVTGTFIELIQPVMIDHEKVFQVVVQCCILHDETY